MSMHSVSEELDQALNRLDPQTASLLEQTVRDAVALASKREQSLSAVADEIRQERDAAALASKRVSRREDTDALGYPLGYFEATAGCFEGEPLQRPPDLPLETRETW